MPVDLQCVKDLCFDVDGTISDTDDDAWVDRTAALLAPRKKGNNVRRARLFARWLVMFTESPMNFTYNLMDALRSAWTTIFAHLFERVARRQKAGRSRFNLMDNARELLDAAVKQYTLTVVSARDAHTTAEFLRQFAIRACIF